MSAELSWAAPYGNPDVGVDHLGLRVAGETAYGELIDFTTTVTWRPRYLSFLCWALSECWERHAEFQEDESYLLDARAWRKELKGADYAYATASVLADPDAQRIVGSRKLRAVLREGGSELANARNHVKGRGSVDVYAGVLRSLRLSGGHQGVERPSGEAEALAEAFGEILGRDGERLLLGEELDREALRTLGARAGVSRLAAASAAHPEVAEEIELLRRAIVPLDRAGETAVARRLGSIGIVLRIHEQLIGDVDSADFRSAVLDRVVLRAKGPERLALPRCYEPVLRHWRWYQVRAYATHALETLFAGVLSEAWVEGSGELIEEVLGGVVAKAEHGSRWERLPGELRGLLDGRVDEVIARLEGRILADREDAWMEPELARELYRGQVADGETLYAAFLLYFLALARMRHLRKEEGLDGWLGSEDPRRLPPKTLLARIDEEVRAQRPMTWVAGDLLMDCVVRQHIRNAHRKLEADPRRDTSRLSVEGELLIAHSLQHRPGSSYPRYANAVMFLRDLRYLGDDGQPTKDGMTLLKKIEEALS